MLIQNMDEKVFLAGNHFYDKLATASQVFTGIKHEQREKSRSIKLSRPKIQALGRESETFDSYSNLPILVDRREQNTPSLDLNIFKTSLPVVQEVTHVENINYLIFLGYK
jgi:hypothetical protein